MRKNLLKLILFLIFMVSYPLSGFATTTTDNNEWEKLIKAIIQVESQGNPNAKSKDGSCVGILQIKKILVDECNRIQKLKKNKERFAYSDRYNIEKSKKMFDIIQKYYNKTHNIEIAIRLWNGGCNWRKRIKATQPYYEKVMREFNKLK